MGWCSGTRIFDDVVGVLLDDKKKTVNKKEVITTLVRALEDHDWDCQYDSEYIDDPMVQEVFKELHHSWTID